MFRFEGEAHGGEGLNEFGRTVQQQIDLEQRFAQEVNNGQTQETIDFWESYEHLLFHYSSGEPVTGYDFSPENPGGETPERLIRVNWELMRKYTQLHHGEEPEDLEGTVEAQKIAMISCREFLKRYHDNDFGLPDPETLPWNLLSEKS